jgi:GntR family transcriptional regulator
MNDVTDVDERRLLRGTPLPVQIARLYAERIGSGELKPGTRLPGEPQLAQQFGVSRTTIREATRLLVGQGLLEAQRGRGTFVRLEPFVWPVDTGLEELVSATELIERAGHKAETLLIETSLALPSVAAAEELRMGQGQRVRELRRVRLADGVPVALSLDCFAETMLDSSQVASLSQNRSYSLLAVLEQATHERITRAISRIEPVAATKECVQLLNVAKSQPLLMLRETYYGESGKPVLYGEVRINTELLSFHVRRSPKP